MWLIVAIASHSLFGLVAVLDRYLLSGPIKNPKFYTFLVGMLGVVFVLFLIPFGLVEMPELSTLLVALAAGALRLVGLFALFSALRRFEASRIIPAIGGFLPIAILLLTLLFTRAVNLGGLDILAFVLLVGGSIWVSTEKRLSLTKASIMLSFLTAILFASSFFLSKFVYEVQPFWSGFFWMVPGGLMVALLLLLFSETRKGITEIFHPKKRQKGSYFTAFLFFLNQGMGGLAFILQSWAIALVPFGLLAFVSALEGIKYISILFVVWFLSVYFPSILREEISKKILLQKILSIVIIGAGLLLLAL
ncbi:MAG TPA: hypothetical protein ENI04_00120 [Candidatus Wildermuthbacteria bacterium]|nr:hypothetical protein [Candidatus Wildermuthbacteria bacterium]